MAGCLVPADDPADSSTPEIATDVTDPADLIASYEQALDQSDFDAYVALLEAPDGPSSGFQFFLWWDDDPIDFPWIVEQLDMVGYVPVSYIRFPGSYNTPK